VELSRDVRQALAKVPQGLFAITSAWHGERNGCLARSVQICADEPVLLSVAVRKGHAIETLIRDSRIFGVCMLDRAETLIVRALEHSGEHEPEVRHDPFDSIAVLTLGSAAPIPRRALVGFDCEVVRHFDLEAADHELYIGEVKSARVLSRSSSGDISAA